MGVRGDCPLGQAEGIQMVEGAESCYLLEGAGVPGLGFISGKMGA